MKLFDYFKNKKQPKTMLEEAQALAGTVIVNGYRSIVTGSNLAPTLKTSCYSSLRKKNKIEFKI